MVRPTEIQSFPARREKGAAAAAAAATAATKRAAFDAPKALWHTIRCPIEATVIKQAIIMIDQGNGLISLEGEMMRTPSSSLREMLLAKAGRSLCGRLSLCVCVRVHGDRRRISHGHRAGLRIIRQLFAGHRFLQRRAVFEVRQFYMRALATDAHREIKQIFPKDTCKANMDTSHKPASLHQDRVRVRVRVEKRADQELERPAAEGVRDGVTCELWKLKHATVRRKVDLISVQPSHRIAHRCAPPQRHISTIAAAAAGCWLLAGRASGQTLGPWRTVAASNGECLLPLSTPV